MRRARAVYAFGATRKGAIIATAIGGIAGIVLGVCGTLTFHSGGHPSSAFAAFTTDPIPLSPAVEHYADESLVPPWLSTAHRRFIFRQIGTASWYGDAFEGHQTANGTPFDKHALTAAHRTLPLGTRARVVNLENGRSVTVVVTDRGPYVKGRIIDLSERAAKLLGMKQEGLAMVAVEVKNDPSI